MTHPQKTSGPRGVGPGIKNEDPPPRDHPQIPKIRGVVPGSQKRETTPLIISFQGPPPGTTPSKINKYHNFNKLQG